MTTSMAVPTIRRIRYNFTEVNTYSVTYWFSYETCVGFRDNTGMYVIENLWGPTTGKHLNYLQPDKSKRLKAEEFESRLNKAA